MTPDYRYLVQRMFAVSTMIAADAEEIALAGQSPKHAPGGYERSAKRMRQAAIDLTVIADAVLVVLRQDQQVESRERKAPYSR